MTDGKKAVRPETRVLDEAKARGDSRANTDDIETHVLSTTGDRIVAWLVATAGPGVGERRAVRAGTNSIGRDPDQNRIVLDFNDAFISRTGHAVLVHDAQRGTFQLADGGKANSVKVNGQGVTGCCVVQLSDHIEIGSTTLRLDPA